MGAFRSAALYVQPSSGPKEAAASSHASRSSDLSGANAQTPVLNPFLSRQHPPRGCVAFLDEYVSGA